MVTYDFFPLFKFLFIIILAALGFRKGWNEVRKDKKHNGDKKRVR